MFEQDYIMREVQKMVQMLQIIIGLKKEKKFEEALQKIDQSYGRFFDRHRKDIKARNREDVLNLCSSDGKFSPDLAFALADTINEEAEVLAEQGYDEKACEKYSIVLELYQRAAVEKGAAVPLNAVQKMNEIRQKLKSV